MAETCRLRPGSGWVMLMALEGLSLAYEIWDRARAKAPWPPANLLTTTASRCGDLGSVGSAPPFFGTLYIYYPRTRAARLIARTPQTHLYKTFVCMRHTCARLHMCRV